MVARRDELARRRRAQGLSQEQLAEKLGVDRSTVARWERCAADPVPWVRPHLAQALRVTLDDLDVLLSSVVEDLEHNASMEPRTPLAAASPAFLRGSARDALAFTSQFDVQANDGIEALNDQISRAAVDYLTDPLERVLPRVQGVRADAQSLLAIRLPPRQSSDLLVVLARALALLANAAMDTGQHGAADDHVQAAVRLAEAAGHHGVASWSRGLQASNAFWAGQYARSASIAATALPEARHGTIGVFLACLLARASGRIGDRRDIADALARADRARERASADEVGGVFAFSEAKQHLYAATAHLGPGGDPARALNHARRAVKQYTDAPARSFGDEAGARIDVATAHLRLGEPDGALEALEPVLTLPADLRVATIRTRLRRVRGELERGFADLPAARDAMERISDFQSTTMAA